MVATATGTLALLARITDTSTREGLRGVLVRLTHRNGSLSPAAAKFGAVVEKTTGEKGIFRLKNLKPGTYTTLLSKPGCRGQTITLSVAQGEMTEMTAEMERA